jgi:paraquat-inducible protein B
MSELKGKAVIGAFVVGAIALAVAAVLVLGGGEFMKKKFIRVMYFDGSVKGLKVGAPVVFQGVQIGSVKEISVQANPKEWTFRVPVIVELDPAAYRDPDLEIDQEKALKLLIEKGLRAKLELQSLVTGMLQVALDFNPDTKARLVGGDTPYPEIPTEQSSMEQLASTIKDLPIKELIGQISDTLASIRGLLNSPELRESLQHLNEALVSARDLVRHADAELVAKASTLLEDADRMVVDIDGQLRPVLAGAGKTVADIDKLVLDVNQAVVPLARKVENTADAITTSAEAIRPAIKQAEKALANIESMTRKGANERESLDDALKELSAAARSIKNWAEYLERHPEALIRGKAQSASR